MPDHKASPKGDNHTILNYEYATFSAVPSSFQTADIGRAFRVTDGDNFYLIRATDGSINFIRTGRVSTVQTTDATESTLATIATTTDYVYTIRLSVTATVDTGGNAAGYERTATFKNDSGSLSIIGSVTADHTAENDSNWDCTIDTSGTDIRVRVTGVAATTINWHCFTEVQAQKNT